MQRDFFSACFRATEQLVASLFLNKLWAQGFGGLVLCVNPAQHHAAACLLSPDGMRQRIRKCMDLGVEKKTLFWLKWSFCTQSKHNKELIHCFPLANSCSATPRKTGLIAYAGLLRRQMPSLWMPSSSSFFTPPPIAEYKAIQCGTSLWLPILAVSFPGPLLAALN